MAMKRKDYNCYIFIFSVVTCFMISTACQVGHKKSLVVYLSPFQKAIEKYEGFRNTVNLEVNDFNSFLVHELILPHSICVLILCQSIPTRKIIPQRLLKYAYEKKYLFLLRVSFLSIPCFLSIVGLTALAVTTCWILESLFGIINMTVPIIKYGKDSPDSSNPPKDSHVSHEKQSEKATGSRARRSLGKRFHGKDDDGDNSSTPPPTKVNKKHDSKASPLCEIWVQTGPDSRVASKHNMDRHPHKVSNKASSFSCYLSFDSRSVTLSEDSYICNACYQDAYDNCDAQPRVPPRWHKKRFPEKHKCPSASHCPYCHQEWTDKTIESPCKYSSRIVPSSTWKKKQSVQFWNQVMSSSPHNYMPTLKESSTLCQKHFMQIHTVYTNKKCYVCNDTSGNQWTLLSMLSKHNRMNILRKMNKPLTTAGFDQKWMCSCCADVDKCSHLNTKIEQTVDVNISETDAIVGSSSQISDISCAADNSNSSQATTINNILDIDSKSNFKKTKHAASFLIHFLPQINKHGYFWRKDLTRNYKESVEKECTERKDMLHMCQYFDNYLTTLFKKAADFSLVKLKNGIVAYEIHKHTEFSVTHIITLLEENLACKKEIENYKKYSILETDIQKMFDEQTKLFSDNASKVDYRDLQDDNGMLLGKYIHKPLFDFFVRILKISGYEYERNDGSLPSNEAERKKMSQYLRLLMGISILCHLKNRYALIMQNIISLYMYAYGLRDSGFHVLNRFGVSCSIRHVRNMAKNWSSKRKCIEEINKKCLWRVTFDNLNFSRKFAKTSMLGGEKGGRMLDLLTGQVSHQSIDPETAFHPGESSDEVLDSVSKFRIDENEAESSAWDKYITSLSECQEERNKTPADTQKTKLIEDLEQKMPDYTPDIKDTIVYATVKEAKSSSISDIADYLHDVKKDLHIGEENYPTKVLVCGDQQTYSLLKNLMRKYPDTFNWIIPMIGDWHFIKLASEVIKSILWDGGFHQLGIDCGHLKEITSWRDIHNIILALHEGLISSAIISKGDSGFNMSDFINTTSSREKNKDEVSCF